MSKFSELASELGKISHKKHPRTRAHFLLMQRKSVESRRKNKLLTPAKKSSLRAVSKGV